MRRGELVTVAVQGDFGKPRPAVVVQSDWLAQTESVLLCLVTSEVRPAPLLRLTLEPAPSNGLLRRSQVMVDKVVAVRRDRCTPPIGRLSDDELVALDRMLALVLGLAD
ncbi:MAG: type II toxin-antitoxin system PemK/MazF family toxin [Gammaproteobacteria bacterium]